MKAILAGVCRLDVGSSVDVAAILISVLFTWPVFGLNILILADFRGGQRKTRSECLNSAPIYIFGNMCESGKAKSESVFIGAWGNYAFLVEESTDFAPQPPQR